MAFELDRINIVLFGRQGSGKTQFARTAFRNQPFNDQSKPTKIVDYLVSKQGNLHYTIWDTSGDKAYLDSIKSNYYPNADLGLYFVDLSQPFKLKTIINDIKSFKRRSPSAQLLVIGSKCDLTIFLSETKLENGLKRQLPNNTPELLFISTKTGNGLEELIQAIRAHGEQRSPLEAAIEKFRTGINRLKPQQVQEIYQALTALSEAIIDDPNCNKDQLLLDFETQCRRTFEGEHPTLIPVCLTLANFVIGSALCITLGFLIGMAAGCWTGPGAFFTAIAGGAAAAGIVVGVSPVAGIASGAGTLQYFANRRAHFFHYIDDIKAATLTPPTDPLFDVGDSPALNTPLPSPYHGAG